MEYKLSKLKDVTTYIARGITPKYTEDLTGLCVINQKCIRDYKLLLENARRHDISNKQITDEKVVQKYDILINSTGVGTAGRVAQNLENQMITADSHVTIVRPDSNKINPIYLGYAVKNQQKYIEGLAEGSTGQTEISRQRIGEEILIRIPTDKQVQKVVSDFLLNVDKKIDLNNKINDNLHELCNNLYINLINQLNENNSSMEHVKNVAKCILGGTPSRARQEYWNGNINWINSGEINKFRIIEASEKITELGLNKSSTYLLPKGTTVLAITGATLGQVSRLEIDSCANQSVVGIVPNKKELNNYIYLSILNNINDLTLKQTGGAQQHINKNDVETHKILIPNDELINEFDKIIKPLFNQIAMNCFENKKLAELRDTLLPKLMDGEIDLNNIKV